MNAAPPDPSKFWAMTSPDGSIVPITITLNERTGLTLWAPPWEDEDGEEWQGFLGNGTKILLFPGVDELAEFVAESDENDLSDHPGWDRVRKLTPAQLRPLEDNQYNLDAVYEWAAGEPDPQLESSLANVVEMVLRIAECCEDGALRRLIGATPEYAELMGDDVSYTGREGAKAWTDLGDTIAATWDRAATRVERWLEWRGEFTQADADDLQAVSVWERIGARPIELVFGDDTVYLTVRAEYVEEVLFLGSDDEIDVFVEAEDLAEFCRGAEDHDLVRLEFWETLADAADDAFVPAEADSFDLTVPSAHAAGVLREMADYCELEADAEFLDTEPLDADTVDAPAWDALVAELATCLRTEDEPE